MARIDESNRSHWSMIHCCGVLRRRHQILLLSATLFVITLCHLFEFLRSTKTRFISAHRRSSGTTVLSTSGSARSLDVEHWFWLFLDTYPSSDDQEKANKHPSFSMLTFRVRVRVSRKRPFHDKRSVVSVLPGLHQVNSSIYHLSRMSKQCQRIVGQWRWIWSVCIECEEENNEKNLTGFLNELLSVDSLSYKFLLFSLYGLDAMVCHWSWRNCC